MYYVKQSGIGSLGLNIRPDFFGAHPAVFKMAPQLYAIVRKYVVLRCVSNSRVFCVVGTLVVCRPCEIIEASFIF